MKAELKSHPKPPPPPEDEVVLTMSVTQAKHLLALVGAVSGGTATDLSISSHSVIDMLRRNFGGSVNYEFMRGAMRETLDGIWGAVKKTLPGWV